MATKEVAEYLDYDDLAGVIVFAQGDFEGEQEKYVKKRQGTAPPLSRQDETPLSIDMVPELYSGTDFITLCLIFSGLSKLIL